MREVFPMTLTAKELAAIEDQLSSEKLLVAKLKAYSQECTDPELKQKCDDMANRHQGHYQKLYNFLN